MACFRVLALDGGGIRGGFQAAFLAEIEKELEKPIGHYFDLIVGTSTGGILAMALAMDLSAAQVLALYEQHGAAIFDTPASVRLESLCQRIAYWAVRPFLSRVLANYGITAESLFAARYDAGPLESALAEALGDRPLKEASRRLLVPAVDLVTGKIITFKTPHLKEASSRDLHYRAADVVRATAAAPIYFPAATIAGRGAYVDGGLWANNPTLVGFAEALRIRDQDDAVRFEDAELAILSIGTGSLKTSAYPDKTAGTLWWMPRIVESTVTAQSQGTEALSKFILRNSRYERIDFQLADRTWTLDNTKLLPEYIHHGVQEAHTALARLTSAFFAETTPGFSCDREYL